MAEVIDRQADALFWCAHTGRVALLRTARELPKDFINTTQACSNTASRLKRYVQDEVRQRLLPISGMTTRLGADVDNLRQPLRDIAKQHRTEWDSLWRTPPSVRSSSASF